MKVVLSGYYGFHNVGDEAILLSIISALRKVNPNVEITVLSNDPDYTEKTYHVNAVNRWRIKEVMAAIKASDGLISGGGSLLQDKTGNRSVVYYSGVMLMARFLGKPFVVYAQGIGPIEKSFNQKIAKFTLSKASYLSVRDEASRLFLEKIGIKKAIEEVPDPVLGLEVTDKGSDWLNKSSYREESFLSVSVRDWPSEVDYLEKIAVALDKLAKLGYEIVFIPMHGEHDEKTSCKVVEMMQEKADVAPYDLSIEEKVTLIGHSEVLIGMRLHALIFAAVVDTPFVALSYDPKIDAFAKQCAQPIAGHVNSDNWSAEDLFTTTKEQLTHLDKYRTRLKQYSDPAKKVAQKTAQAVSDTLKRQK